MRFPGQIRVLYGIHDVSELLSEGENVLGVMLGRGRYGTHYHGHKEAPVKLLLQLDVFYTSGKKVSVISSSDPKVNLLLVLLRYRFRDIRLQEGWKFNPKSPILSDDVYDGEMYDARCTS